MCVYVYVCIYTSLSGSSGEELEKVENQREKACVISIYESPKGLSNWAAFFLLGVCF